RYRAAAVEAIAAEIELELRSKPQETMYELQLAEMLSRFEPQAGFDLFSRAIDEPRGEAAYDMLRIAICAGQPVTRAMIERCEGPWRPLAMTAVSCKHQIGGRLSLAQRWRTRTAKVLAKLSTPADHSAAFELAHYDKADAIRRCD